MLRSALMRLVRALLFFVVYWSFAPVVLWDNERQTHFIESCVFAVIATFVPWRRTWRAARSRAHPLGRHS
jgi:hypothetical protein